MSNEIRITVEEVPAGTSVAYRQLELKTRFPVYRDWIGELALGQPWSDLLRTHVLNATKDYYPDADAPIESILAKLDEAVVKAGDRAIEDVRLAALSSGQRRIDELEGFTIDETVNVRLARTDIAHYSVIINDHDKQRIAAEAIRLRDEDGYDGTGLLGELRKYVLDMIGDDPSEYRSDDCYDTDYGDEEQMDSDSDGNEVTIDDNTAANASLKAILDEAGVSIEPQDEDEEDEDEGEEEDEEESSTPPAPQPPTIRIISHE
jgi:hypothetical protein